ncbi:MAG: alkaline phosphatase family protein [Deltaproteobacteria bacterium]|nr:alkaline phosphatase family protein [Deltaproteobacteria bacterium]
MTALPSVLSPGVPDPIGLRLPSAAPWRAAPPESGRPLFVFLGFDGADWKVLKPMIDGGDLPNLAALCAAGTYGRLKTDVGLSPISWTTMLTGRSAKRFGVDPSNATAASFGGGINHRRYFFAWDLMHRARYKVALVDFPYVRSAEVEPGIHFMQGETGGGPGGSDPDIAVDQPPGRMDDEQWRRERYKAGLLGAERYDAFFVFFNFPDIVHHAQMLSYTAVEYAGYDRLGAGTNVARELTFGWNRVRSYYFAMDWFVGLSLKMEPDYLVVASDHGARPTAPEQTWFFTSSLLEALGLNRCYGNEQPIRMDQPDASRSCRLADEDVTVAMTESEMTVPWLDAPAAEISVPAHLRLPQIEVNGHTGDGKALDVLRGRAERLRCRREAFLDVENDATRRRLTLTIRPDAVTQSLRNGWGLCGYTKGFTVMGEHDGADDGMMILAGHGVRRGYELRGAKLEDVMPTVMHLAGLPVARNLDGRLLEDAFLPEAFPKNAVVRVADYGRPAALQFDPGNATPSPAEIERLRSLGYLQ